MKKILALCLSLLMLTAFGCKSTGDGDAPASAAEAKGGNANANAPACATRKPNPDAPTPEELMDILSSFAESLDNAFKEAHDDCDRFGANLNKQFDVCEENFAIAMRNLYMVDWESPEGKEIDSILVKLMDQLSSSPCQNGSFLRFIARFVSYLPSVEGDDDGEGGDNTVDDVDGDNDTDISLTQIACATRKLDPHSPSMDDMVDVMSSFFVKFNVIMYTEDGGCPVLVKSLNRLIDACEDNLVIAFRYLNQLEEGSPESKKLVSQFDLPEDVFEDRLDSCQNNGAGRIGVRLLGIVTSGVDE